jgi:hypothetical protein
MSQFNPLSPYGNFVTSDPNGLPIDRRPLHLGLYLQNQTFSSIHNENGRRLLQKFKYFRNMRFFGNGLLVLAGTMALAPEVLDCSLTVCQAGLFTGFPTALAGSGVKLWSRIQTDEITAELETDFSKLKENVLLHNKNNPTNQMIVPYLADTSLSERLAEAHIAQSNAGATTNLSTVPSNVVTAGIMLEALKAFKGFRKN